MCTIFVAYKYHSKYPLLIASNRDEFYVRPTSPAGFWQECPKVLAGRDLQDMGTWLGITKEGRLAALTNYRDPSKEKAGQVSRGEIVANFLLKDYELYEYARLMQSMKNEYNGFNVIFGDINQLLCYSNVNDSLVKLDLGISSVSNAFLNTPWPKVVRGKELMKLLLDRPNFAPEDLFELLSDKKSFSDDLLPDTGVGLEWERVLSSIFVDSFEYGTRSSTVISIDNNGNVEFVERSNLESKNKLEQKFQFSL